MSEPAKDEAELIDQEDIYAGLFWVRASDSYWQTATPGEACAEIKRLRAENARLPAAIHLNTDLNAVRTALKGQP